MKKILERLLAGLAKLILRKYQPKVVGITGSIGKTSAKEAVFAVLKEKFNVRTNLKNYNNELGLPLSIIGQEAGGKNLVKWSKVFWAAFMLLAFKDKTYPEILVLEMGADHPGDIEYLVKIAPCDVGVITRIGPTHLEFFKTVENVAREKRKMVTHLTKEGVAILNVNDPLIEEMAEKTRAKVMFFGYGLKAEVASFDLEDQGEGMNLEGIKFKIQYKGSVVPVFLPKVVGAHQINSALIGAAVGLSFGLNLIEIANGLKNYKTPKGRMNLIQGKNKTLIIDDTYNSSPKAVEAALETIKKLILIPVERKVAILGDMLELGEISEKAHREIGVKAAEAGCGLVVCVGEFRVQTAAGAKEAGLAAEAVVEFKDSLVAREKINQLIKSNDLILVKGSQGSRMERVVKALMLEPERAEELLVRMTQDWID